MLLAARTEAYIAANATRPVWPSDVAAAMQVNLDYLSRSLKAARGYSVTQAIQRRWVAEARTLLRDTNLSTKQLAKLCGFSDSRYLRSIFRRYEGLSPIAYRRLYARTHANVI